MTAESKAYRESRESVWFSVYYVLMTSVSWATPVWLSARSVPEDDAQIALSSTIDLISMSERGES